MIERGYVHEYWRCPNCNAYVKAENDICWKCNIHVFVVRESDSKPKNFCEVDNCNSNIDGSCLLRTNEVCIKRKEYWAKKNNVED